MLLAPLHVLLVVVVYPRIKKGELYRAANKYTPFLSYIRLTSHIIDQLQNLSRNDVMNYVHVWLHNVSAVDKNGKL